MKIHEFMLELHPGKLETVSGAESRRTGENMQFFPGINAYFLWETLFPICVDIYSVMTFDVNIVFLTSL